VSIQQRRRRRRALLLNCYCSINVKIWNERVGAVDYLGPAGGVIVPRNRRCHHDTWLARSRWIVETAGSRGINYAVHSFCISASLPEKTQTKNIIVRPLGPDRAAMGQSFEDLKDYQR
jgi:hypothetical protein